MNDHPPTNIWRLLEIMASQKTLIIWFTILAVVGSIVVAMLLPKWYKAEALLLPPRDATLGLTGASSTADAVSLTGGIDLPIMVTPADVYARMLQSRSIIDGIIKQFELRTRYKTSNSVETRKELLKLASFRVTPEGLLSITVEDRSPDTSALIANSFVSKLDSVNQTILTQRARQTRIFLAERLKSVDKELKANRDALQKFQVENHSIDFDEQTHLAFAQATGLKITLDSLNIAIDLQRDIYGEENQQIKELYRKRNSINEQLQKLIGGTESDSSIFSLPLGAIPKLKGEYEQLMSRVEVSEALHKSLLAQFEQAKIQEESESTPLSVLDYAEPPELRSRPQRTIIVSATLVVAFLFSLLLASFIEFVKSMKVTRPEDYVRYMRFMQAFFGWLPGVSFKQSLKNK